MIIASQMIYVPTPKGVSYFLKETISSLRDLEIRSQFL